MMGIGGGRGPRPQHPPYGVNAFEEGREAERKRFDEQQERAF